MYIPDASALRGGHLPPYTHPQHPPIQHTQQATKVIFQNLHGVVMMLSGEPYSHPHWLLHPHCDLGLWMIPMITLPSHAITSTEFIAFMPPLGDTHTTWANGFLQYFDGCLNNLTKVSICRYCPVVVGITLHLAGSRAGGEAFG